MTNLEENVRFDAAELKVNQSLYPPIIKCILFVFDHGPAANTADLTSLGHV